LFAESTRCEPLEFVPAANPAGRVPAPIAVVTTVTVAPSAASLKVVGVVGVLAIAAANAAAKSPSLAFLTDTVAL
jgi:hypothetical protein